MPMPQVENSLHRYPRIEKLLAVASFLSADGMGFLAFMLSENHDIETGPLWFIAQMLLLCATLLGIDLKIRKFTK